MSESAFFCSVDSDGNWWVILEEINMSACDDIESITAIYTIDNVGNGFQFLLHIEDELAFLPLLRHLCKYLAWTVGTLTSKEISSTILNEKQIYILLPDEITINVSFCSSYRWQSFLTKRVRWLSGSCLNFFFFFLNNKNKQNKKKSPFSSFCRQENVSCALL